MPLHPTIVSNRRRLVAPLLALALLTGACSSRDERSGGSGKPAGSTTFTPAQGTVRGFDGQTITLASIGIKGQLPGAEIGARARIERFNDDDEIEGVKLEYAEFADDKLDAATSLSEMRRLVTQVKAFAIVGDVSRTNPVEYMAQQHVPYFGWAFDDTYCSEEPDPDLWGFGFNGCLTPSSPTAMPDASTAFYEYVADSLDNDHPTLAMISGDNSSGRDIAKYAASQYGGAGFDVVFHEGIIPPPPVSDYTPYVQQILSSDQGGPPDVLVCLAATDCIPIYAQVRDNGYEGVFMHPLYSDQLLGPMEGSIVQLNSVALNDATPGVTQLNDDVAAIDPNVAIDTGVSTAYMSTDMFIQALKTVAEKGEQYITPENVRLAAAHQTWEIEGLAGPTKYPDSTVMSTPACAGYALATATEWRTIVPFACTDKRWPILPEYED